MGSMREVLSCIEVSTALGYARTPEQELLARIDHVLATLFKLSA